MRALFLAAVALLAFIAPPAASQSDEAIERTFDAQGRLIAESGSVRGEHRLGFVRHFFHEGTTVADCTSSAYKLTRWHWDAPYAATTSAYATEVAAGLAAWDDETSRALVASVTTGAQGVAGRYDGVNQLDWVDLGATSTIAVTTTWFYRGSGLAVESDGQYNTRYAWATDGAAGAMDVQNIVAHEVGHTFGLDHPKGKDVGCLTMYAYGSTGETQKRTLGTGDILGLRALYGS